MEIHVFGLWAAVSNFPSVQLWEDRYIYGGVMEKHLFRQRVFLMCATNREHVSTLNEGAYQLERSGVESIMLREATGATKTFAIASGEMVEEDYAKTDAAIFQKKQQGAPNRGSTKTKGSRHSGSTPHYSHHTKLSHMSQRRATGFQLAWTMKVSYVPHVAVPNPWKSSN